MSEPTEPQPATAAKEVYSMSLGRNVRLGRVRPRVKPQAIRLAPYLAPGATPPPASVDWYSQAKQSISRMYLNDLLGDCVIAGKMHFLGAASANDKNPGGVVVATDTEVRNQYVAICGPGDQGCVITDVLNVFKTKGLTAGGRTYKIDGYVSVENTDRTETQIAIFLFGGLTLGINIPQEWVDAPENGVWDATNSGIVGGHDVEALGYNSTGVVVSTWGGLRTITWRAFTSPRWVEETYAKLAPIWYGSDKVAPSGFNYDKLLADLRKIGGGEIPDITPTPPPVVPPPVTPPPVVPPVTPPPVVAQDYTGSGTASGSMVFVMGGYKYTVPVNITINKTDLTLKPKQAASVAEFRLENHAAKILGLYEPPTEPMTPTDAVKVAANWRDRPTNLFVSDIAAKIVADVLHSANVHGVTGEKIVSRIGDAVEMVFRNIGRLFADNRNVGSLDISGEVAGIRDAMIFKS